MINPAIVVSLEKALVLAIPPNAVVPLRKLPKSIFPGNTHLSTHAEESNIEVKEVVQMGSDELLPSVVQKVREARVSTSKWEQWLKDRRSSNVRIAVVANKANNFVRLNLVLHEDRVGQNLRTV